MIKSALPAIVACLTGLAIVGCTSTTTAALPTSASAPTVAASDTPSPMPLPTLTSTPSPALASSYDSEVPTAWFNLYLKLAQETVGYSPPVTARAFGYAGVTLYESVLPGMPDHQTLAGQLNGLARVPQPADGQDYDWPTVANSALALLTRRFFKTATAENLAAIDAMEQKFVDKYQPNLSAEIYQASVDYGRSVASAIYDWSLTDGGDEGYLRNYPEDYVPPTGPGKWIPTPPTFSRAMNPTWGQNRPMVLEAGDTCAPPPPMPYSEDPSSPFYAQALEVYDTVKNNTADEVATAKYWTDNPILTSTPSGHWTGILTQIIIDHDFSLDVAAEAYARTGIAASDAFLGCWNTKYQYNTIRPISYIQEVIDSNWDKPDVIDPVISPPFPEYTSGHSVSSAAIATVLTDMFGDNFSFTDQLYVSRGMSARTYKSFYDAMQEAAFSRLHGGIHFRYALEKGLDQGRCIGQHVLALKFRK